MARGSVMGMDRFCSTLLSATEEVGLMSYSNSTKYSGSTSAWLNTNQVRCFGSVDCPPTASSGVSVRAVRFPLHKTC